MTDHVAAVTNKETERTPCPGTGWPSQVLHCPRKAHALGPRDWVGMTGERELTAHLSLSSLWRLTVAVTKHSHQTLNGGRSPAKQPTGQG